jgi:DNA-binding transcriptional LysR family regulator
MADRLTSMAVFVKTAETGSFSAAARALGMSAQMAGKHIDALETQLGMRLLHRSTRRHSLTDAGRLYLDGCRRVLAEDDAATASVLAQSDHPRGTVRVTAPNAFGACRLMPEVSAFLASYPEVAVDLVLSDRNLDLMEEGIDVAIRIGQLPASDLIARPLADYRLIACASPAYLAARGVPVHPRDLAAHDCLHHGSGNRASPRLWTFTGPDGVFTAEPANRLRVNDGRVLVDAAVAGGGIILAGEPTVHDHLVAGRLARVLEDYPGPVRAMHLVYPGGRPLPPKLRVLTDWMLRAFGP